MKHLEASSRGRLLALGLSLVASLAVAAPAPPADPSAAAARAGHIALTHRLLKDIEAGVARVEPWLDRYGYWAVFGTVGVEGFGIPAPGQTILEAASAAATAKAAPLRIQWVLLAAFVAAALGNSLGYLIGRSGGRGLLTRLRVDPRHLQKIDDAFTRYGGLVIVFARFFDGPRQLNGIAAGMLEMPWVRFTLFNLVGAALWVVTWGLGVYYLDLHLDSMVAILRQLNPWVAGATLAGLGVLALALVAGWLRHRQRAG